MWKSRFESIRAYGEAVLAALWYLVFGVIAAVLAVLALTFAGLQFPLWSWLVITVAAYSPAQIVVFHRQRLAMLAMKEELDRAKEASTTVQIEGDVVENKYISYTFVVLQVPTDEPKK